MNWSDLSMKDRASYTKLMVENGIYNLNSIRTIYIPLQREVLLKQLELLLL